MFNIMLLFKTHYHAIGQKRTCIRRCAWLRQINTCIDGYKIHMLLLHARNTFNVIANFAIFLYRIYHLLCHNGEISTACATEDLTDSH